MQRFTGLSEYCSKFGFHLLDINFSVILLKGYVWAGQRTNHVTYIDSVSHKANNNNQGYLSTKAFSCFDLW